MIKKRIFLSSKKNDLRSVHKLQNYLINCNEAKIILIKKMIDKLCLYYSNKQQIHNNINQLEKLKLLRSIFIKKVYKNKTFTTLIKEIKQSLIYCSIKPAFEARLTKQSYRLRNINKLQYFSINFSSLSKNNVLIKNIVNKLTSYNYINNSISQWLYETDCFSLLNKYNLGYRKYFIKKNNDISINNILTSSSLFYLICEIIKYDIYWYSFICYKTNSLLLIKKPNNALYNIKSDFCHKDFTKLDVYFDLLINNVQCILLYINSSVQSNQVVFHNIFNVLEHSIDRIHKHYSISYRQNCSRLCNLSIYYNLQKKIGTSVNNMKNEKLVERMNTIKNQENYIYYLNEYYFK